jgi:hypothetical protein
MTPEEAMKQAQEKSAEAMENMIHVLGVPLALAVSECANLLNIAILLPPPIAKEISDAVGRLVCAIGGLTGKNKEDLTKDVISTADRRRVEF